MAWTTPAAWNTGVVKDAAFWNAQVKANLEFLYGAPSCRVYNSANESIIDSTATALTECDRDAHGSDHSLGRPD